MRYLFVTDIHSTPLEPLETMIEAVKPQVVAALGDYDSVDTLRRLKNLEDKLRQQGVTVHILPGNHDDAICYGIPISSPEIPITTTFEALVDDFRKDPEMCGYLNKITGTHCGRIKVNDSNGNEYAVLLFHGALDATEETNERQILVIDANFRQSYNRPMSRPMRSLWYRLKTPQDHAQNFAAMKSNGFQMHIRGHDAWPEHASLDSQGNINVWKLKDEVLSAKKPYDFGAEEATEFLGKYTEEDYGRLARIIEPGSLHTITVGDYAGGFFGVLDTEVQVKDGSKRMVFYFCGFEDWFNKKDWFKTLTRSVQE